jgi:glycosyltransferase involved in cell wall biosynthesis
MSNESLSLVIPVFNPVPGWEKNFSNRLLELEHILKGVAYSVILVNDGSTKGLTEIEGLLSRFDYLRVQSYERNKGKGFAIRHGVKVAETDLVIYTDIDFPFGCSIIADTLKVLRSGAANIVIGTRSRTYFRALPLKRRIFSLLLKRFNYVLTGFKIRDTQAGLKGLDSKAKAVLASTRTNTFLFELEFLRKSLKQGLKYQMIDIEFREGLNFTNFSTMVILKEILSFVKIIFRIG